VDWVDDPDSRVDIVATAVADLKGIARLGRALLTGALPLAALRARFGRTPLTVAGVPAGLPRQLVRFGTVGVLSTLAYLALFALLRPIGAQPANFVALLVTAVGNTALNRRLTFGVRGSQRAVRHQLQGLFIFAVGLGLTSGALAALGWLDPHAARLLEIGVLVVANLLATLLRFVMLRVWVFRRPGAESAA
jgi:putative flippase GtrA